MSLINVPTPDGGASYSAAIALAYTHIAYNGATTLKIGSGLLHLVVVSTAGTAWTITVYDNDKGSGKVIAIIDGTSKGPLAFNCLFANGLTIVTSGGAAGDITVVFV